MSDASAALALVTKLITLATDPAATEEEARTAAFQACRLIRQHHMLDGHVRPPPPPPPPRSEPPPPPPRARHDGGPRRTGRFMRSRFQGVCKWCHQTFSEGDVIYWRGTGAGSDHESCAQERFDVEG